MLLLARQRRCGIYHSIVRRRKDIEEIVQEEILTIMSVTSYINDKQDLPLIRNEVDRSLSLGNVGKSTLITRGFISSTILNTPASFASISAMHICSQTSGRIGTFHSLEASTLIIWAPHRRSSILIRPGASISPSTSETVRLDRMCLSSPETHFRR